MYKMYLYACVLVAMCVCSGCVLLSDRVEKSVVIANTQDQFQIWDIVVETRQKPEEQSVPVRLEMQGRMKWLRVWDKYCCSSRVSDRWGSWFVWMFYDNGRLSYPPVEHPAARPTIVLDECNRIYTHITVPKRGALAHGSYLSVQVDMDLRECLTENDWDCAKKRDVARYNQVERPNMRGEVRLRVKLFCNSSLKVASNSDSIVSLSAEQCDLKDVRLFRDPTREPQWGD